MSSLRPAPIAPALPAQPSRKLYRALVVALAAFLATITLLRQPFRGYLAEVQVSGHAGDEIDLPAARQWLASGGDGISVQVVCSPLYPGDCELKVQKLAPRSPMATTELNQLASRFLESYLPQQQATRRQAVLSKLQAELAAARDAEDVLRIRAQELRDRQMARLAASRPADADDDPSAVADARQVELVSRLQTLRSELSQLLANCTDEHPQVITLRSQIARIEGELAQPAGPLTLEPSAASEPAPLSGRTQFVSTSSLVPIGPEIDLAAELEVATAELTAASRNRQWTERQLQASIERFTARESLPTWSATSARVVARVGGTPTPFAVLIAGLAALTMGGLMFVLAGRVAARPLIDSAEQLAALLPVPLVGQTPAGQCRRLRDRLARISPAIVCGGTRAAELLIVAIACICLISVLADQSLASELAADPLGTFSEIIGRIVAR